MKKIILFITLFLLMVGSVMAGSVERTVSDVTIEPGDTISITYTATGTLPLIKQNIPTGWTVINDAGGIVSDGILRTSIGGSTTITLKAPQVQGDYVFSGQYTTDGGAWLPFSPITVNVGTGGDCTPSEVCGDWSECVDDEKERTCNDGCGATDIETDDCGIGTDFCQYMEFAKFASEENYCTVGIGIILGILILLILLIKK